jgi:homoserine dehydrogenase
MRAQNAAPLTVLKFGSSVLAGEEDLPLAVHEIYRFLRAGHRVLAVVSALGRTTDRLLEQARRYGDDLAPPAVAALLATGEATAAALLALALDRAGIPATLLDPRQARLRTAGPQLDASPCGLDADWVARRLACRPVAVLPGFVGEAADGSLALLGRGGTDLTALYVAHRLGADACRLVKDVDGIYDRDPEPGPGAGQGRPAALAVPADGVATPAAAARRFRSLAWNDAAALHGRIVQGKALAFAARHQVRFAVAAPGAATGTQVGPGPTRFAAPPRRWGGAAAWDADGAGNDCVDSVDRGGGGDCDGDGGALRVVLLGHGTVGGGVYRHLLAQPRKFQVVGVAVRDVERHARLGVPAELLSSDPWSVLARPCDLVIELIGGEDPAARLIAAALARGLDVVTANKEVIAAEGEWLCRHAAAHGAQLAYAAAVGGAVPMLEAVVRARAQGEIRAVSGVVNGTCNYVLDQLGAGVPLDQAVRAAQQKGFAEADPSRDLDGRDAACKLRILARLAFGVELAAGEVERRGLESVDAAALAAAEAGGRVIRLVAECRWRGDDGGDGGDGRDGADDADGAGGADGGRRQGRAAGGRTLQASVGPVALPVRHYLAGAQGEQNRVLIERRGAPPLRLSGRGAGRWATSEAVMADVLDIARHRRRRGSLAAGVGVGLAGVAVSAGAVAGDGEAEPIPVQSHAARGPVAAALVARAPRAGHTAPTATGAGRVASPAANGSAAGVVSRGAASEVTP